MRPLFFEILFTICMLIVFIASFVFLMIELTKLDADLVAREGYGITQDIGN